MKVSKSSITLLIALMTIMTGCVSLTSDQSSLSISSSSESSLSISSSISSETLLPITPIVTEFDFDLLNDLNYEYDALQIGTISHIEGHNIASGDYEIGPDSISIAKHYLLTLLPGTYELSLYTTLGRAILPMTIIDRHNAHRIVNRGFETGDLFGWSVHTIFKGEMMIQAFRDTAIVANETIPSATFPYDGEGSYVLGRSTSVSKAAFEERLGQLRSSTFTLGGSGHISFLLGAGKTADLSYVSIRRASDDLEIKRFGNQMFDVSQVVEGQYFGENLVKYRADLSSYLGSELYIELSDFGSRDWDFLTADAFETYYDTAPEDGVIAVDIKPNYLVDYAPNQVANGDFTSNLTNWTISDLPGWQKPDGSSDTFIVTSGSLRSNATGDSARGLIRSSLFRVDGSGIASFQIGAAQGSRYDKDTFVSIKHFANNREVIRFANNRSSGTTMIQYFIDLSDYQGQKFYVEIVDNATGSWDTIFIDNIVTYYATRPSFTYATMAINLNY